MKFQKWLATMGIIFLPAIQSFASSVAVSIEMIDPDPTWLNEPTAATAIANFTADGREQEQIGLGFTPQYRWKWELLPDGAITGTVPAADPQDIEWTV